jgi:hypothetical protein
MYGMWYHEVGPTPKPLQFCDKCRPSPYPSPPGERGVSGGHFIVAAKKEMLTMNDVAVDTEMVRQYKRIS